MRFKSDLLSFDYCTYLGGSNAEQPGGGVKIDGADDAYVSIWSSSGELYTSPNAYQPEFAEQDWFSNVDCYIFKMNFCPSASIQFNAPLCEGDTLMLNGAGGDAYSWTGPDGFAAFGSSQVLQNVQVSQSGVYTLTASTSQAQGADKDCSDTVSVTVDIYEMPEAVIESNNPVCEGDTLIVMSSGPYQMHWTGPEGLDSLTSSISFPDAASSMSGYYYLNVSYPTVGSIECADSTSLWVTVNPLPEVMLTLGDTICQNTPAFALSGGLPSGGTYSGAGISSGYFIAANAGVGLHEITYSYTDENGCSQSASSTLEVVTCIEVPEQMNESIWQIYPNPFENELHIISDIHPFMIRLFNSIGQEVFVQSNPVTHIRADLTALSSGVYLLELESKNGQRGVYVLEKY